MTSETYYLCEAVRALSRAVEALMINDTWAGSDVRNKVRRELLMAGRAVEQAGLNIIREDEDERL